jgi:hypothetical protein
MGLGLDLDLPTGVEEAGDDDHGGGRAGVAGDRLVRSTDRVGIGGVDNEHPGAHQVVE